MSFKLTAFRQIRFVVLLSLSVSIFSCPFVILQVESPFPPSDKIGINSVQREVEEIIPMKQMKMDWVPYIPLENRS